MTIRLVADSTCDLPEDLVRAHQITIIPAYINIGDQSYQEGIDLQRNQFYADLPNYPAHPTTAAPSPGVFTTVYEQLAQAGATAIISVHIAGQFSSFLAMAHQGGEAVSRARVIPFDSQTLSMGIGLQVLGAAEDIEAGLPLEEVLTRMEDRRRRVRVYAGLDTLEFLRRGGRVSFLEAGLGALLKIKPIMQVNQGEVNAVEKVRTSKRVPEKLVEIAGQLGPMEALTVLHANAEAEADALREQLRPFFPGGRTPLTLGITPALGVHIGPGAIGFACILRS